MSVWSGIRQVSQTEIAYCAGLYEGEGNCHTRRGAKGADLQIAMCDKEPLLKFQGVLGGNLSGPHPPKSPEPNAKPYYTWSMGNWSKVEKVINLLSPYLSPRRLGQFELAQLNKPTRKVKVYNHA